MKLITKLFENSNVELFKVVYFFVSGSSTDEEGLGQTQTHHGPGWGHLFQPKKTQPRVLKCFKSQFGK